MCEKRVSDTKVTTVRAISPRLLNSHGNLFGGDMVYNDEFTLSLMTNKTIIEIDQNGYAGREVYRKGNEIVWAANGKEGKYYVAQFNIGEEEITAKALVYAVLQREIPIIQ